MSVENKQRVIILEAAMMGCNTTLDIADVTGLSVGTVSSYVSEFIQDGILKRSNRKICNPSPKWGPNFLVFEINRTLITSKHYSQRK